MLSARDENSQGGENSQDERIEAVHANNIELPLTKLFESGALELPDHEHSIVEHVQPSEEAKRIGKRVRERILLRLGQSNLGTYISREREAKGIKKKDVLRQVKLASEILAQLEANHLGFFRLPPAKAADLVQVLDLDPVIVLRYLEETRSPQPPSRIPAPFFRMNKEAEEGQRVASQRKSEETIVGQNRQDSLQKFLEEFRQELARRGLLVE
jgi:hypothetical protein